MTLSVRTIPAGLKPRDFLVYSLKNQEEGYHVMKGIPTLVGQLKSIDVSASGYVRYSMVRLIPRSMDEFFVGGYGLPVSPIPARHTHGEHEVVTPGDYILVGKRIPPGWFGVKVGMLQSLGGVTKTLRDVAPTTLRQWFPYRPDTPTNTRHPWGCAFESETDAVTFQAHMATNT